MEKGKSLREVDEKDNNLERKKRAKVKKGENMNGTEEIL